MSTDLLTHALLRDRRRINQALDRALKPQPDTPSRLTQAMRYAVLGPGKRLRPALCLWAYRAAAGRVEREVMPFCCGIEFIHTFSLIHDDLPSMDDDDFRRARPSLHRRFDEATAILAADGLFALAFELFARAPGSPARKLSAVAAICAAVGPAGMTGGQFLDISARPGLSARAVAGIHQRKTAAFIAASLVAGATVAGARPASLRRLHRAGIQLGLLFQLTDDLLDRVQPSDHRLPTMVTCHGLAGARRIAARAAALAESGFLSLGPGYEQLARIPALVQTRRS